MSKYRLCWSVLSMEMQMIYLMGVSLHEYQLWLFFPSPSRVSLCMNANFTSQKCWHLSLTASHSEVEKLGHDPVPSGRFWQICKWGLKKIIEKDVFAQQVFGWFFLSSVKLLNDRPPFTDADTDSHTHFLWSLACGGVRTAGAPFCFFFL